MYDSSNQPKELLVLFGGYHCGFLDRRFPLFCDSGAMDHQVQLNTTREQMVGFFDAYLKGG
jgi:hypothetical protein